MYHHHHHFLYFTCTNMYLKIPKLLQSFQNNLALLCLTFGSIEIPLFESSCPCQCDCLIPHVCVPITHTPGPLFNYG